jgi:hypothetical protein
VEGCWILAPHLAIKAAGGLDFLGVGRSSYNLKDGGKLIFALSQGRVKSLCRCPGGTGVIAIPVLLARCTFIDTSKMEWLLHDYGTSLAFSSL